MDGRGLVKQILIAIALVGSCAHAAWAQDQLPSPPVMRLPETPGNPADAAEVVQPPEEKPLELVEFKDLPMGEAARILSDQTGLKIVPSAEAAKISVSLYLRNVSSLVALDALTKANGLFYRQDPDSEIIRVYTLKEYESDLGSFREEETQVFTLLYPNPVDVAVAIRDIYGDRVRLSLGIGDMTMYQDLIQRFVRYNLVANQNQQGFTGTGGVGGSGASGGGGGGIGVGGGLGGFGGGMGGMGGGMGGMMGGMGGMMGGMGGGMGNMMGGFGQTGQGQNQEPQPVQPLEDLNAEQIQALVKAQGDLTTEEGRAAIDDLLRRQRSRIYVSVLRRNNQLVVRTSDSQTIKRIRELVTHLDVPTPLVLLEVKVLSLDLGDNFTSAFDMQFGNNSGELAGGFTSGDLLAPLTPLSTATSLTPLSTGVIAPGVANIGTQPAPSNGPLIFQYVSNNFRARIQLLENDNRVTELATPMLLTANNEVSRIFIGTYTPIVTGYSQSGAITGGNTTTAVQPTPQTTVEAIGQGLLITPNINADRTVTLRISQQNSQLGTPAVIPLINPITGATDNQSVDTVQTNLVTGTIVAKDGLTVALGGLISEEVGDTRAEVPVLGKLPVVGFFFRRQVTLRTRTETIILIRPYVFNTPAESAALSADLIPDNSLHPKAVKPVGSLNTFGSQEVVRPIRPRTRCKRSSVFIASIR